MRWSRHLSAIFLLAFVTQIYAYGASGNAPVHKQRYLMGTVFEIVAYDNGESHAAAAIDVAFKEIERLDSVMSNYKPESELSRLNRNAHFRPQTVSRDLYRVIEESLAYSRISEGEFDITVGPLVDLWKAQQRGERTVTPEAENEARACVGFRNIELLPPDRVLFHSSCLRIDVGGIGKGYAVDRAAEILRSRGIRKALINAGGSTVYAVGAPPGESGWRLELRDPSGKVRPSVVLADNSVSTSEQTPPSLLSKQTAGHIIDPQSGVPVNQRGAVSVVTKTATASDALSTTMLLVGPERGKTLISTFPETTAVWILTDGHADFAFHGANISTVLAADEMKPRNYPERSSAK
jgi:thiamine biosynthesis lipoprotein